MKKLALLLVGLLLLGPSTVLLGVAVLMNPAAHAACLPGSLTVGPIPDSHLLRAHDRDVSHSVACATGTSWNRRDWFRRDLSWPDSSALCRAAG